MKQGSLFFKGKIIVVDLDLIHSLEKLESMMKSTPYPIVYTSTDIYQKKYYELRKKHTLIRFQKIADFAMYNLLTSICKKEQIPYSDFAIKHLVRLCESDIRAAIISLCCLKEEGITPESVKSIAEYKTSDVFQTLLNIFGNDLKKARESLSNTEQDILPWIEANANDSTSLSATENIAKADLFKARVMKRQAWNLEKYYYDMIAGISARKICKKRFDPPFARKPEK
jgi:DNA polymerase III delta prime subunit